MNRRIPVILAAVLTAAVFTAQCSSSSNPVDASGDAVATEQFSLQFPTTGSRVLGFRLQGINGNVDVSGRARSSSTVVTITGEKRVQSVSLEDAEEQLAELDIELGQTGTDATITTVQPSDTRGRIYTIDYTILLPLDLLVGVTNTNGDITVQTIFSDVTVVNTNGRIEFQNIEGSAAATTTNGDPPAE